MKTGASGKIHLSFSRDAEEATNLRVKTQSPPLRVIRAFEHEPGVALVHLHNVSGGILGGDQFEIDFELAANAHALITTTGSNRIYRHREGYKTATQTLRVNLAENSTLEYIPDSTIPFANSRYRQQTQINLQAGATLFWSEIVAPGREAYAECFAWDSFENETRIVANNRPILIEHWQLNPDQQALRSLAYMGQATHSATFTVCHCGISDGELLALENALTAIAIERSDQQSTWGVSRLVQDGVVVRGMSQIGRILPATLAQFHDCARQQLIGKPLVLPRKIN